MGKVGDDLSGQRFGNLVALSRSKPVEGRSVFLCRCDCGIEKIVRAMNLLNGNTKGCSHRCATVVVPQLASKGRRVDLIEYMTENIYAATIGDVARAMRGDPAWRKAQITM